MSHPGPGSGRLTEGMLRVILGASIVSTGIHYTDNFVDFHEYPQPDWIEKALVMPVWIAATALAVWAYVLYRRGDLRAAAIALVVYSVTGLSSLGHYLYGPPADFSPSMHVFILTDGVSGALVLGFAFWTLRSSRRAVAA